MPDADTCFAVRNAVLVHPGDRIEGGSILVRNGRIEAVGNKVSLPGGMPVFDAGGHLLTPGLIDLHAHGIHNCRYDAGPEDLRHALSILGRYGCTCVLPTLLGRSEAGFLQLLADTAAAIPSLQGAAVPGLHLEGPFLAYTGAGCVTVDGDISLLREMLDAAEGRIAAMSISPEVKNIIPVIEHLVSAGVLPFITHTGANLEDTRRAIEAGARHATHFYDVFYPQPETDIGVRPVACTEAILADRRVTVDFICDGVHVDPVAIRMALCAKTWKNVILITDANVGAGLPPGEYDTPWGFRITVHPDKAARIIGDHKYRGALAGSALTMNRGMRNLLAWFGDELSPEQIWAMGTANPAQRLGLVDRGYLRPGMAADLVLWNDDLTPIRTWVGGNCVYSGEQSS